MKKIFLPLILIGGIVVGAGTAYGTSRIVGPHSQAKATAAPEAETSFVSTGKVLAPLVMADGRLSGYVSFELQLEVVPEQAAFVTARLPLLLNAINLRTYRTPMAAGPDGMLPDLKVFRKIVMDASPEAFGRDVVRRVAITQASPA